MPTTHSGPVYEFFDFRLDCARFELLRNGHPLRVERKPMELLILLASREGQLVSRAEIAERLWSSEVFVDTEHGINTAIRKLRYLLRDDPDDAQFIQTVTGMGYRFIAPVTKLEMSEPVETAHAAILTSEVTNDQADTATTENSDVITESFAQRAPAQRAAPGVQIPRPHPKRVPATLAACCTCVFLVVVGWFAYTQWRANSPATPVQRSLTRLTFDPGLQLDATWSPDGRYIAYASDRGGKFDIWVQQVSGGDPVRVTHGPVQNRQPDWSPDGKYIAYRSEEGDGGIYVVPALGGVGLQRKIAPFGYYPRWSPDGSQILFRTTVYLGLNRFYVVGLDGGEPREVLTQFNVKNEHSAMSAAWYPDGKRVTVWVWNPTWSPNFWTVPLDGGTAIHSEFTPAVAKQLEEVALRGIVEWTPDYTFFWSPSGRDLYCELTFRGAMNAWRLKVDPKTLRITGVERLTTGAEGDGGVALSRDGHMLAFTAESQHIRAWLFPLDSGRGKLKGDGQPVSPEAMQTWRFSLSKDGQKLAFAGTRSGRSELWVQSLLAMKGAPLIADDRVRDNPRWSPDGKRLIYERYSHETGDDLTFWSVDSPDEQVVCDAVLINGGFSWSPDGQRIMVSQANQSTNRAEIWLHHVPGGSASGSQDQRMVFNPAYDLFHPSFSPDGRWIVFQAMRDLPGKLESTVFVAARTGGPWVRLTDGKHWDGIPRWSPDGRAIYFISGRGGFFNVWAIRFDPSRGSVVGEPFAVTKFDSPARIIPQHSPSVDISVAQDKLVVTVEQTSGSIWVLDNVDR